MAEMEKTTTKIYEISVRALVEFILRSGSIESGFASNTRALEGTRLHQKLQKAEKEGYEKEVVFQKSVPLKEGVELLIEGRADGIYTNAVGERVIDEIKSTVVNLEYLDEDRFPLHWAQAKCYAHMLALQEELNTVVVRLSYIHVETEQVRYLFQTYTAEELRIFWEDLIDRYSRWILWKEEWDGLRTESLQKLQFPFEQYRPGQRTMAAYIYKSIQEEEKIFLQAPTGIGKTVSSLFPALKAMGQEQVEKIFYLTAKNVTGQAAVAAVQRMRKQDVKMKSIRITSKDRICMLEKRECDPEKCPYANGHFDRVNEAVLEALQTEDEFDKEVIQEIAEKHQVCPFELSLDIATWADLMICDYNYAFDPTASLKRFFQDRKRNFVLLVDEAHNLVDRAREMFSAEIHKQAFLDFRSGLDKKSALYKRAGKINSLFLEIKKWMGEDQKVLPLAAAVLQAQEEAQQKMEDGESQKMTYLELRWYNALRAFADKMEEHLALLHKKDHIDDEVWELYFRVLFFLKIWDQRGDGYECYFEKVGRVLKFKFFCADPSEPLRAAYQQVRSVIFFSATLMPIEYYKELLGGKAEEKAIALPSPFDPKRKKVMVSRVKASYQGRQQSMDAVCEMLHQVVSAKEGHYMVFFPSFAYLDQVWELFTERYPQVPVLRQESQMREEDRAEFLKQFEEENGGLLGFCVLGGVFSEGIDLRGRSLVGVVVVSVGIPQIGTERDLIREHLEETKGKGYEYAYMYPGIGKVFQAAGRVIRTEEDEGIILLLDDRFDQQRYYQLYPPDWFPVTRVSPENLSNELDAFWRRDEKGREHPGVAPSCMK